MARRTREQITRGAAALKRAMPRAAKPGEKTARQVLKEIRTGR
jgi:hypothetical protein